MIQGSAEGVKRARQLIERYAGHDFAVLVQGESGVGKELAARAVHRLSKRARGPFVAVNCGALPRDLVEAQLFGTSRGAFTGAETRPGLVTQAQGGTLFLDEIGELAAPAQSVLLRVLETHEVWPIGARASHRVDFRLVSATHQNLRGMLAQGTFRSDLFHRISMLSLTVPPLRERVEDLPELAWSLAPTAAERLTDRAWRALAAHDWPGNVRELRNILFRAEVGTTTDSIDVGDLGLSLQPPPRVAPSTRSLETQTAVIVHDTWQDCDRNVRATARVLKVSPTTVYRYLALTVDPS